MDNIYIALLIVLFLLAIFDLIVGVSNDAVNFLVSALGSKAAPFMVVMIVASLGVLVGATFSSGMMEVARKGIFHPDKFFFAEIMMIFMAVMLTDIVLLDLFNTFGMPTSTTVSIVFELLGGAVAVALSKMTPGENLGMYINSGKAILIVFGILLSVIVAFNVGAIVQFISRLIFSFQYEKSFKYFGVIWGTLAITAITYFILIKGLKGSSFIEPDQAKWIKTHTLTLLGYTFAFWFVTMALLTWLKVNTPKLIVLVGTFALAMAFAGNDLVNFIGVPLAGLKAAIAFSAQEGADPMGMTMEILTAKTETPTTYLLIAGLIMVTTLWMSKKSKTVTETSINLSRQQESGTEQFDSTYVSRFVVRMAVSLSKAIQDIAPKSLFTFINSRLAKPDLVQESDEAAAAFDLIRASVNLAVASILISIGTSLKLPLSTTYVTFMVAMGTSLADGAWGRSTAVYRITGVLSVITGWFVTAIIAFTISFTFATIIHSTGLWMVFVLFAVVIVIILRLRKIHKVRTAEKAEAEAEVEEELVKDPKDVIEKCISSILKTLRGVSETYSAVSEGLENENRTTLKGALKLSKKMNKRAKRLKDNVVETIKQFEDEKIEAGYYYVQVVDFLREVAHTIEYVARPSFDHLDNNHARLNDEQLAELKEVVIQVESYINLTLTIIQESRFDDIEEVMEIQNAFLLKIKQYRLNHFDRIKNEKTGPKNSLLFLNILTETQNMLLFTVNLLKSQRDFISHQSSIQDSTEL